ncbi:MAG: L,D-transpeptidase [Caulobacteraceae bacterium]|nr:L,D-transpeptidase [Caulobacteraceae bacterium]
MDDAARRFAMAVAALCLTPLTAAADPSASLAGGPPAAAPLPAHARFKGEAASGDTMRVADWVIAAGDNHGAPFIIIDKVGAEAFVFDGQGLLLGAAPVLLGLARGDDSAPGIGSRKLATIRPEERTTPAGRFVAGLGHDFEQDILWIDYGAALSLHRVIKGDPRDHRAWRLATADPSVRRISYGCVNVPAAFYETVVHPAFTGTSGVVYILPEVKPVGDVFPEYGLAAKSAEGSSAAR